RTQRQRVRGWNGEKHDNGGRSERGDRRVNEKRREIDREYRTVVLKCGWKDQARRQLNGRGLCLEPGQEQIENRKERDKRNDPSHDRPQRRGPVLLSGASAERAPHERPHVSWSTRSRARRSRVITTIEMRTTMTPAAAPRPTFDPSIALR